MCIWGLKSSMSDTLFLALAVCFRSQIFGYLSRTCHRQATCSHCGKLPHRPCPNPASCVNCGGPHLSDTPTCHSYLFKKTALEIQSIKKLIIQSAPRTARALPPILMVSYTDIMKSEIVPSQPGLRVLFSPSLSSTAPASAAAEFICPKRTSVYSPSG